MKLVVSEDKENDLFLRIKMIILNNRVNLNNVVVTKDFIRMIVNNQERFKNAPLVCDTKALLDIVSKTPLQHKYDWETQEFKTVQIGNFVSYSTMEIDDVLYLCGEAVVPKKSRHKDIVDMIIALNERNDLKFSYEISVEDSVIVDGIEYITGNEGNALIGVAIVSDPAIPEAKALMVAEKIENPKKEDTDLENEKKKDEVLNPEEEVKTEPEEKEEEKLEEEESGECKTKDEKSETETQPDADNNKEEIVQLSEEVKSLKAKLAEKESELEAVTAELNGIKEAKLAAERKTKEAALRAKASDVFSEEEMDEMKDAFASLDENYINQKIVDKLLAARANNSVKEASATRLTDSIEHTKDGIEEWLSLQD